MMMLDATWFKREDIKLNFLVALNLDQHQCVACVFGKRVRFVYLYFPVHDDQCSENSHIGG